MAKAPLWINPVTGNAIYKPPLHVPRREPRYIPAPGWIGEIGRGLGTAAGGALGAAGGPAGTLAGGIAGGMAGKRLAAGIFSGHTGVAPAPVYNPTRGAQGMPM